MSSSGPPTGGGATASLRYFCHQCNRTVMIESSASGELACPMCHGGFIEEFELPSPNPTPSPPFFSLNPTAAPFFPSASPSPIYLSRSTSFDLRHPSDIFSLIGPDSGLFRSPSANSDVGFFPSPSSGAEAGLFPSPSAGPEPFNPFDFLQRYIQTLLSDGANIQIVFDGGDRPIGNLGDYFIGPGLEQLIQQLAENDPNRYGTPPAAKTAVASLPDIKITDDLLASDEAQCAVCKDFFEIGEEVKQMPCKHIFHKDCILPWLELHNSCPVCRYELPTDDSDYEQRRGARNAVPPSAGVMNSGGSDGARVAPVVSAEQNVVGQQSNPVERRFRISLPWPFRGLGSQAEGSNTAEEQGSGRSGGGNEASGSEARQDAKD
ncbi:E3 ubiquitin-protein ligase RING1-like [Apostasia shenzhenica]|uniref:RING-type E3 ubiquitin transferase n=1 Tax=Apostasia shenzhenica TaxID=1088818 RepID=A0A2H9ZXU0_9ASPA|nr:E3 ubiquitin-protein ligase RING1-like [Apostasia shenzhenica]